MEIFTERGANDARVIDNGNYPVRKMPESWNIAKTVSAESNSKPLPRKYFILPYTFLSLAFFTLLLYSSFIKINFSFVEDYRLIAESLCFNHLTRERYLPLFKYDISSSI